MKKTILITGSTDGIGKLAAIKLAKEGHEIYLHGRNADKLTNVITEVKAASGNDHINGFVADFSELEAVKNMATEVNNTLTKLDVLINNAGVFKSPVHKNKAGLDIRFTVNYFAPYVLANNLLPLLRKGTMPSIINLSSAAQDPVDVSALDGTINVSDRASYGQSKLALTMWSFYLNRKLSDIGVVAVNPGSLLNTNMVKEAYGKFWSSADKGADILYDLATLENYEEAAGKYFDNDQGRFGQAHGDAYDAELIESLINATENII